MATKKKTSKKSASKTSAKKTGGSKKSGAKKSGSKKSATSRKNTSENKSAKTQSNSSAGILSRAATAVRSAFSGAAEGAKDVAEGTLDTVTKAAKAGSRATGIGKQK